MTEPLQDERRWIWVCPECGEQGDPTEMALTNGECLGRHHDPVCYHDRTTPDGEVTDVEVAHERVEVVPASSLDQALAERDRLAEVAKEMAELLKIVRSGRAKDSVLGGRVASVLDRYEALKEEAKAQAPKPHKQ